MALIERLEAATGADQKFLLREAFDILLPEPRKWNGFPWINPRAEWVEWYQKWRWFEAAMRIGACESAALLLVPEGMRRRTMVMENGRAGVQLWWPDEDMPGPMGQAYANEPIAICIAALRAGENEIKPIPADMHLKMIGLAHSEEGK